MIPSVVNQFSRVIPESKSAPLSPEPSALLPGRRKTRQARRQVPPIRWQRLEAQGIGVAVQARAVAPSTVASLASQGALMPSRDSKCETVAASHELTVADGVGLRRLPMEILALIAADASDQVESALTLFSTLTAQNDDPTGVRAHARDSKVRTAAEKAMLTHNPYLRFSLLVRDISCSDIPQRFPTLQDVRAVLRQQAIDAGITQDRVDAWLTLEETVFQLVEKHLPPYLRLRHDEWTQALAERRVEEFDSLWRVPPQFISYAMCLRAVNSPRFRWDWLLDVPERHRTPEILDRALSRDPDSIYHMKPAELTPARLATAARGMGFEEFEKFLRSERMTEDPECQKLLAQLEPPSGRPARR